jgi:hypothetical protein
MTFSTRGLSLLLALVAAACTGQGPDVVDPTSRSRSQSSILAVDVAGGSELAIVKEPDGIINPDAYADANTAPLGRRADGLYQSYQRLFMLHRDAGAITVIDLESRIKLAEITGFADTGSALNGLAFSNLAQGWAIDHSKSAVFHIDAVNHKLVDTLAIEGQPTSIATLGTKVFVASVLPDGSGVVSVFQSNFTTFRIDHRLTYPSPIIFMAPSGASDAMVMVSAGAPGGAPIVYLVSSAMQPIAERVLETTDLRTHIGGMSEFAALSRENYLYVATAGGLFRVDANPRSSRLTTDLWAEGSFTAIAVDYWTDLLYAFDPAAGVVRRYFPNADRSDREELDPLAVPSPVSAIEFVNSSLVY